MFRNIALLCDSPSDSIAALPPGNACLLSNTFTLTRPRPAPKPVPTVIAGPAANPSPVTVCDWPPTKSCVLLASTADESPGNGKEEVDGKEKGLDEAESTCCSS